MNKYFIFYKDTKEVIALYQADQVDLDRYVVEQGPEVAHALVINDVQPHECQIVEDDAGNFLAIAKE